MKAWAWILIFIIGELSLLAFLMIVPVIIYDQSWWWFFAPLIGLIAIDSTIGVIILIIKLQRKPIPEAKIDLKDAKDRVVYEAKYDNDNPDNFRVDWRQLVRIGEKGSEKTPIAIFRGIGTELNQKRVAIVNLNNPKKETMHMIDPTEELIREAINLIAEHPPEPEIKEEITSGIDMYGRPMTTTKIRRPSSIEAKKEAENKALEERGAI